MTEGKTRTISFILVHCAKGCESQFWVIWTWRHAFDPGIPAWVAGTWVLEYILLLSRHVSTQPGQTQKHTWAELSMLIWETDVSLNCCTELRKPAKFYTNSRQILIRTMFHSEYCCVMTWKKYYSKMKLIGGVWQNIWETWKKVYELIVINPGPGRAA